MSSEFGTEQRKKTIEILSKKWRTATCRACGHNQWIIEGYSSIPLSPTADSVTLGGKSIPSVVLVCKNCGLIEHVSSKVLGL